MIDIKEIRKLSVEERILLVEDIWDSIVDDTVNFDLDADQKKELDRRIDKYEKGEGKVFSWAEIRLRVQNSA